MTFTTDVIAANEVRIPDPRPGRVAVISRYGKERAMLIHPSDFHRLEDFDRLLTEASRGGAAEPSAEAVRAHRAEDTPGAPITDPALLATIFD